MMDILFDIFIKRLIIRFFGLYSRYIFFRLIGKEKTLEYLSGENKKGIDNSSQDFLNALVGLVSLSAFVIIILKIIDMFY